MGLSVSEQEAHTQLGMQCAEHEDRNALPPSCGRGERSEGRAVREALAAHQQSSPSMSRSRTVPSIGGSVPMSIRRQHMPTFFLSSVSTSVLGVCVVRPE